MLTTPITTPAFHRRVQELVTQALQNHTGKEDQASIPIIPPLSILDTPLTPGDITSQLLAFVSPWIDLCSPDPLISNISRQVLYLEIAYAAFCGIEYVFIPGPRLYHGDAATHGTPQYARAVQEALSIGSHLSVHIIFPMIADPIDEPNSENGNLASQTRPEYLDEVDELRPQKPDIFGTWDAWNTIRTVCKYSNRLFVGKNQMSSQLPRTLLMVALLWFLVTNGRCRTLGMGGTVISMSRYFPYHPLARLKTGAF